MDANMAHYCLHKHHWSPEEYLEKPKAIKAFIIASTQVKIEAEKKAVEETKNKQ